MQNIRKKPVIKIPKKEIICQMMEHQFYCKCVWILLIASFLNEINAKYLPKSNILPNSKFGYYWWLLFYMNSHNVMSVLIFIYLFPFEAIIWHNQSPNMKIEPNISHAFKIDPIKFQIWNMETRLLLLADPMRVAAPFLKGS